MFDPDLVPRIARPKCRNATWPAGGLAACFADFERIRGRLVPLAKKVKIVGVGDEVRGAALVSEISSPGRRLLVRSLSNTDGGQLAA